MKTVTVYQFSELEEEAQENAIENERRARERDPYLPWMEETVDSMKAVFEHTNGIKLTDWSIGPYDYRNHVSFDFNEDNVAEFSGKRALAWLENNLFYGLRVSWTGKERWKKAKYGERAGTIPCCPFTGYCADDDFLDELRDAIKKGYTLKDAFSWLADRAQKILEDELDYYLSDESIREYLKNDESDYMEDGERV